MFHTRAVSDSSTASAILITEMPQEVVTGGLEAP
jgi:hypothetical protein